MGCRRQGFTLIELLVVIAIIVVLAAILFPVFANVRKKAHQTQCLSNVRQIGMAMQQYSGDYDYYLPLVRSGWYGRPYLGSWVHALDPYIRNYQIFICPSSSYQNVDWRTTNHLLLNYGYPPAASSFVEGTPPIYSLVSFNGTARYDGLGGYGDGAVGMYRRPCDSKRTTHVERPSEVILVSDHCFYDWGLGTGSVYYPAVRHMTAGVQGGVSRGQINCCFVDGHAKALQHDAYWEIRTIDTQLYGLLPVYWHFWPYD